MKYKVFCGVIIRFFQRATGQHTHCDHANFGSKHVFWCKEVPLRGLNDSEPFLGFQGQKKKFSPEIGISHVKLKCSITRKLGKIAIKCQHSQIGSQGRAFRIRHFYFSVTSSSGQYGDDVISGLHKKPHNSTMVLDRQKIS